MGIEMDREKEQIANRRITANYNIKIPSILIEGKDVINVKPIEVMAFNNKILIFPPGTTERKPTKVIESKHWFEDIKIMPTIKESPLWHTDNLWIQIESKVPSGLSEKEMLAQLNARMYEVVYRFLRILRRKLPETPIFLPAKFEYSTCIKWAEQTETTITVPFAFRVVSEGAGLTKEKLTSLQKEMGARDNIELWEDFIEDAKAALQEEDLNRAILYSAIACETFIKQHTRKIADKQGISEKFWNYLNSQEPEIRAIRYYGPILHLINGHSLEDENKELYKSLERLFKQRNKIMHEGKRSFSNNERIRLKKDIKVAEQVISWVLNLE